MLGVGFANLRATTPQIGSLIETAKEACGAKAYGAGGESACVVFVFKDFEKREEVKKLLVFLIKYCLLELILGGC